MASKGGSSGGDSKAIRAGRAEVELAAKDVGLSKALDKMAIRIAAFARSAALAMAGIGVAMTALVAGSFKSVLDRFDAIKKASDRLGTTAEIWSALGYAIEQSGGSVDDLETALKHLQKNMSSAADDGGQAAKALDSLGLSADDLLKLPLDEQLAKVADAMADIKNPADRTRMAMEIFGKSGTTILPLLKDGAAGVRDLMKEAGDVGSVVTQEQAANAERAGDAISRAWTAAKNTFYAVGAAILPAVDTIEKFSAAAVGALKNVRQWMQQAFDYAQTGVASLRGSLGLTGEIFGKTFQGILDSLRGGSIKTAAEVAGAGLQVAFREALVGITVGWNDFKKYFVDLWHDAIRQVKIALLKFGEEAFSQLAPILAPLQGMTQENFKNAVKGGRQLSEANINQQFAADKTTRDQSRSADVVQAQRDLEIAKAQLKNALDRATLIAEGGAKGTIGNGGGSSIPKLEGASLGAFSGPFKQIFGSINIQSQQLTEQKKINTNLGKVVEAINSSVLAFS